jgi:hypothetical protein
MPISLSSKLELVQSAAPILILMTEKWATKQSCIHIEITHIPHVTRILVPEKNRIMRKPC